MNCTEACPSDSKKRYPREDLPKGFTHLPLSKSSADSSLQVPASLLFIVSPSWKFRYNNVNISADNSY